MMTREKSFYVPKYVFWPTAFLAALAVSTLALWWVMLVGGNPFKVTQVALRPSILHPGSVAMITREICADGKYVAEYRPWVKRVTDDAVFMLQGGMLEIEKGCNPSDVGFFIPALPPGRYQYSASLKFQNNLVGRDEHTLFPPIEIEINP